MKKFVCIDTCIFTDCCLLETRDGEIIANALKTFSEKLEGADFTFLLPEVVKLEFPKAVETGFNDIKKNTESLKTYIHNKQTKDLQKLTDRMRDSICTKVDEFTKETEKNIQETKDKIEKIFENKNTKVLDMTPDLMMEAYKHYITGKKPKSDKGGGGIQSDCIIILSLSKFLKDEKDYELIFCSSNKNDFAESDNVDNPKIHPDITGLFTNIKLYNNLFDFLNAEFKTEYKPEVIEKVKEESMVISTDEDTELTGIGIADQSKPEENQGLTADSSS